MSLERPWIGTVDRELRVTADVDGWQTPFVFLPGCDAHVSDAAHTALLDLNLRITWRREA